VSGIAGGMFSCGACCTEDVANEDVDAVNVILEVESVIKHEHYWGDEWHEEPQEVAQDSKSTHRGHKKPATGSHSVEAKAKAKPKKSTSEQPPKSGTPAAGAIMRLQNGQVSPGMTAAAAPSDSRKLSSIAEEKNVEGKKKEEEGKRLFEREQYKEAIDCFMEALKIDPDLWSAQMALGGCLLRLGRPSEAITALDEVLQKQPENLLCLRDRAQAKYDMGDYAGSVEDYNAKLRLAPADGRALCGRGQAKQRLGDKQGAIVDFEMAKRLGYKGSKELLDAAKKG